jgi:hypothetical protein
MSKIIKIVGTAIATEVMFALGKGYMLACVRKFDPETGDEIRDVIEKGMLSGSIVRCMSGAIVCKADDLATKYYVNRKVKEEELLSELKKELDKLL